MTRPSCRFATLAQAISSTANTVAWSSQTIDVRLPTLSVRSGVARPVKPATSTASLPKWPLSTLARTIAASSAFRPSTVAPARSRPMLVENWLPRAASLVCCGVNANGTQASTWRLG